MINSEVSDASYVIQGGVTSYPIGFEYHFNEQNSPQLLVKIGDREAKINVDFQLSSDNSEIILIPTEEEAKNQTSPNDTRWMERINGEELYITRNIPFKQTSDYTVGRISPEQIEYDFDRTVMRDQEILRVVKEFGVDVALAESLSNAAVETANEAVTAANTAIDSANNAVAIASETVSVASEAKEVAEQASRDAIDAMAESSNAVQIAEGARADIQDAVKEAQTAAEAAQQAAASVANKQEKLTAGTGIKIEDNVISTTDAYSKTEIDNKITVIDTAIDANTEAIQKTREDYIEADSEIHQILNSHAGELSTLRGNQASLGNQVAGIEAKIPGTASGTNYLVTKQMLLDEEMDIREDLNESVGELQTQITAQAAEIAKKQDELTAGENITIVDGVISSTGGGDASFPDQSGNAGKFLQTDGSAVKWAKTLPYSDTNDSIVAGFSRSEYMFDVTAFGKNISFGSNPISITAFGHNIYAGKADNTVFGSAFLGTNTEGTIVLGQLSSSYFIGESNSFFVAKSEGYYKLLDMLTGTIPAERLSATEGTAGQVLTKTETGMEWKDAQGGGASGDYLPLSGGTLTGKITRDIGTRTGTSSRYDKLFDFSGSVDPYSSGSLTYSKLNAEYALKWNGGEEIRFLHGENSNYGISLYFSNDVFSISPVVNTSSAIGMNKTLGKKGQWWDGIYTKYIHAPLSSGSSYDYRITVPSKTGTMALIEDLDERIGDISTALAAILGE